MTQTVLKIVQSRLSMQAEPLAGSISKPLKILLGWGTRPNKKINVNVLLWKVIPRSVRLQLGVHKSKMWSKP